MSVTKPRPMTPTTRYGCAIKLDSSANDVGIAAVAALPQTVAQHRDMAAVRAVFRGSECAPGNNWSAEHCEVIRRNVNALHLLRMVATGDIESRAAEVIRRDLLKNARLLTPDIEFGYVGAGKRSLAGWCSSAQPVTADRDRSAA